MSTEKDKAVHLRKAFLFGSLHVAAGVIESSRRLSVMRNIVEFVGLSALAAGSFTVLLGGGVGDFARSFTQAPFFSGLFCLWGAASRALVSLPGYIRDVKELAAYDESRMKEGARSYLDPVLVKRAFSLPQASLDEFELAELDPALEAYLIKDLPRDMAAYKTMTAPLNEIGLEIGRASGLALAMALACSPVSQAVTYYQSATAEVQKPSSSPVPTVPVPSRKAPPVTLKA